MCWHELEETGVLILEQLPCKVSSWDTKLAVLQQLLRVVSVIPDTAAGVAGAAGVTGTAVAEGIAEAATALLGAAVATGPAEAAVPPAAAAGDEGGVNVPGTAAGVTGAAVAAGTAVATGIAEAATALLGAAVATGTAEAVVPPAAAAAGVRGAGEALATGSMVPEAEADAPSCGWIVVEACGFLYVDDVIGILEVTGGLDVTAGLLGPSPKPSKRPPKKPRGGMGGNTPGCATQCCACSEKVSSKNTTMGCHAVRIAMHLTLHFCSTFAPRESLIALTSDAELLLQASPLSIILQGSSVTLQLTRSENPTTSVTACDESRRRCLCIMQR